MFFLMTIVYYTRSCLLSLFQTHTLFLILSHSLGQIINSTSGRVEERSLFSGLLLTLYLLPSVMSMYLSSGSSKKARTFDLEAILQETIKTAKERSQSTAGNQLLQVATFYILILCFL